MRPLHATIHLAALRHNLQVARQHAGNARVMAVVKANGYGHGLLRAASAFHHADAFAVLGLNEAVTLRDAGYQQPILLLEGVFEASELSLAAQLKISVAVHNEPQLRMLELQQHQPALQVFAKLNSGMNRLGFAPDDYAPALRRLEQCAAVQDIVMMTHFATADEAPGIDPALALFRQVTQGFRYPASLANSATVLRHPQAHADVVRPGIMLYGASPVSGQAAASFGLQPAMHLHSEIIAVQHLQAGDTVGYGNRYTASQPTRIGVVACGYADGYPRHAPNGTPAAVDGKLTVTLGRVSMDMLCVDLTDNPGAGIGSQVELWGAQVPVDSVAQAAGTIGYELLCAVAPRVNIRVVE